MDKKNDKMGRPFMQEHAVRFSYAKYDKEEDY